LRSTLWFVPIITKKITPGYGFRHIDFVLIIEYL